jgi:polyribonucleotide 5'-hydroxyl-kinase
MAAYANLHIAFEQMRVRALRAIHGSPVSEEDANANSEPPRVLILGPENSGKTTVCKILTNYAVRAGQEWSPLLVNVDPSEVGSETTHDLEIHILIFDLKGGWSVPGAISAVPVHTPLPTCSPANPLGSAATSAPTALSSNALLPLVYWYGHAETKRNPLLLDRIIRNLGENIFERLDYDVEGAVFSAQCQ